MNDFSKRVAELSAEKRALLAHTLEQKGAVLNAFLPSFAQQRLWFLDQLQPGHAFYNIPVALRLQGPLDAAALEQSLNEIVQRHESLRTTFATLEGRPAQVIAPQLRLPLPLCDLHHLAPTEREAELLHQVAVEAQRPFDLEHGPLVRTSLLHLQASEHVLLLTMHHIISDAWSMQVFLRELAVLYQAFSTGAPSPLAALPIQYADFTLWQRQWLQGEELDSQMAYWKQHLAGAPAVLELPTDYPRPAVQRFRGVFYSHTLPAVLSQHLHSLSQQEGVTLFMTLLAAFQVLLARYSGQQDIVVGSPIANRTRAELEELIGFFVNTLVLRTDLSGDPSFREVVARVREVCLGAYAHQDVPFEKLVEVLQPQRDPSRNPLFQVAFALKSAMSEPLQAANLTLYFQEVETEIAKFDLVLEVAETAEGLRCHFQYNTDLFATPTIQRLAESFHTLLEAIVHAPQQPISALPLVGQAQREQLLALGQGVPVNAHPQHSLLDLFEQQAQRTPQAVAVVCDDERLTYQQLNQQANHLAHFLQAQGVAPEVLVALYLPRSLQMVVALLAILKAGGAYLPLDPTSPAERLAFLLTDAQPLLLLTRQDMQDGLPPHNAQVICLDHDWPHIAQHPCHNPGRDLMADNLIALLYTSGSTGRPKGTMLTHKGFENLCHWYQQALPVTAQSRVLVMLPISFDAAFKCILTPLMVGGRVILARGDYYDPSALLSTIDKQQVTSINSTPSLFHPILDLAAKQHYRPLASLASLTLGGEPMILAKLRPWLTSPFGNCTVFHLYGPTECSDLLTGYRLQPEQICTLDKVAVGRPIHNVHLCILDATINLLQPWGVIGEVCVGGQGLARGLLHKAEITAEKFVPNPFVPGARLYRTGDLGRWSVEGQLELLGRTDQQVKIRGTRIELGEIEAVLGQHPLVQETLVLARTEGAEEKRLVAYVVPVAGHRPTNSELHTYLQDRLPAYMLPSAFVVLSHWPLSANGKIDRQALPPPNRTRSESRETYALPRDTLELQLIQIFEDILAIRPIDITDNFFALGGHSLLAVRLMAQIQKELGMNLPLSTLFQGATVEQLARILRSQVDFQVRSPVVGIQPRGSKPPFFCVHPVGGEVLCYIDLARHLGLEQPFYGLQSLDPEGQHKQPSRLEDMAALYLASLQSLQPHGPYYLGGWSMGGLVAFEMALQLQQQGHEVALLALLDTPVPSLQERSIDYYDDATVMQWFMKDLEGYFLKTLSPTAYTDLQQIEPNEQLQYVFKQAIMADLLPPEVGFSQLHRLFSIFKINVRAMLNYTSRIYPGRLTLFSASEETAAGHHDSIMGWKTLVSGRLEIHNVPGNHYTLIREPNAHVLAEQLTQSMKEVQAVLIGMKQP